MENAPEVHSSKRTKRKDLLEEAKKETERILDIFHSVEFLYNFDLNTLKGKIQTTGDGYRSVKAPGPLTFSFPKTELGPPFKADVVLLLDRLPVHLLACLLMREPRPAAMGGWQEELTPADLKQITYYQHVLHGLDVLHSICTLGETFPLIANASALEAFQGSVVDLVTLVLVQAAGSEADAMLASVVDPSRKEEALDRAAMVPAALKVLLKALRPAGSKGKLQLKAVCAALLVKPRSAILIDAAFDAVRTLYRMIRAAMVQSTCTANVYELTFHAGAAMDILQYLAGVPLFYFRMAMNPDMFSPALRLIHMGFLLHDPPLAVPPCVGATNGNEGRLSTAAAQGGLELLAARVMALMLSLSAFNKTPFMDHIATHASCKALARQIIDRALHNAGLVLTRAPISEVPVRSSGEGQMAINTLQLAEMLADDSNYRRDAMIRLAPFVADLLSFPLATFKSSWCAGEEALALHMQDLFLDGEGILICQNADGPLAAIDSLKDFVKKRDSNSNSKGKTSSSKAQHAALCAVLRSTALYKLLGNLHLYNSDVSPEADENLFARELVRHLLKAPGELNVQQAIERLRALDAWVSNNRSFALKNFNREVADHLCSEQDLYLVASLIGTLQTSASK